MPINKRKIATVVILFLINTLNYMDRYIIYGILSKIQEFYNLSNGQAGLLQTVFLVSYIAFSFIIGILGDLVSRKILIILGLIIWSFCSFAGSFVPPQHWVWFYVSRSLVGIGEATISTLGFTVLGDLYVGTARTRALSLFMSAMPFGSGIGYIFGPWVAYVASWHWSLRLTPWPGVPLAALLFFVMKEPQRGEAEVEEGASFLRKNTQNSQVSESVLTSESTFLRRMYRENLEYFYRRKAFITCTMAYTGVSFVFGGLAVWVPKYMEMVNNHLKGTPGSVTDSTAGMVLGAITLVTGLFGVMAGGEFTAWLRKRYRPAEIYVCVACCSLSSLFLYFTIFFSLTNLFMTWVCIYFTLFSLSIMWSPNGDLLMTVIGPLHRSRASAIQILCIHALGDAISPLIIGYISDCLKQDNSDWWNLKSLYFSMYVMPFFLLAAAFAYTLTLFFYDEDHQSALDETAQLLINSSSTSAPNFNHDSQTPA